MAFTVITPKDLGTGLKVESNKVVVDVAALSIPVDVKLSGVSVNKEQHKMTFTLSDGTNIEQDIADFLTVDTDTKIVSGSYADSKITLVDSANQNIEVDLATLVTEVKGAAEAKATELVNGLKDTFDNKLADVDAKIAPAVAPVSAKVDALEPRVQALETAKGALEAKDQELEAKVAQLQNRKLNGVELTSLAGESLGYLVTAADVNAQ